eukprot:scaffold28222_cov89-Phaeocystis_antarctica.AAC.8
MVVVSCFQKNSASATGACVAVRAPTAGRPVQALNGVGHIIGKGSDPLRVLAAGQLDDDDVERRAQGKLLAPATTFLSEYRRHTPSAGRPWSSPATRNLSGEPSDALKQVAIKLHEDRACAECTCRRSHYMRAIYGGRRPEAPCAHRTHRATMSGQSPVATPSRGPGGALAAHNMRVRSTGPSCRTGRASPAQQLGGGGCGSRPEACGNRPEACDNRPEACGNRPEACGNRSDACGNTGAAPRTDSLRSYTRLKARAARTVAAAD